MGRIKAFWLARDAIIGTEQHHDSGILTWVMGVDHPGERLLATLRTRDLHPRCFTDLDGAEPRPAIMEGNRGHLVAGPFKHFVQVVERLSLERNRSTRAAAAAAHPWLCLGVKT